MSDRRTPARPGIGGRGRARAMQPPTPVRPPAPQIPGSGIGQAFARGSSGVGAFASPNLPGPSTPTGTGRKKSSSIEYSPPREPTIHNDVYPDMAPVSGAGAKGPKDPNQVLNQQWPEKVKPLPYDDKPPDGMIIYEPPFHISRHRAVTWHNGMIPKKKAKEEVVIRRVMEGQTNHGYSEWMLNERKVMNKIEHKYILKATHWCRARSHENMTAFLVVFPKMGLNLEDCIRLSRAPMASGVVKLFMGQIVQALAFMHEKNYVHTGVCPSSIRMSGLKHVRLSRLMHCQHYSPTKKVFGIQSDDPSDFFFYSPERNRQGIDPGQYLDLNRPQEQVLAEQSSLIGPPGGPHWDAKADDVWAFGCTILFLLTADFPFTPEETDPRNLLQAFKYDLIQQRILDSQVQPDAKEFLLWILKSNQAERPSMEQIANHPWLRIGHPSSPHNAPHLSTDAKAVHEKSTKEKDFTKTFRKIQPYIRDDLVAQMVAKGYAIQHQVGEGGFGAVYKGILLQPSGERIPIAMKMIKGHRGREFLTHRWKAEYKVMTDPAFRHPNLIKVFDVFKEIKRPQHMHSKENRVFIFMELATSDLHDFKTELGKIPEHTLKSIMAQVIKGLEHLHKNHVAHRDIKPGNILLCGPNKEIAKLTDYSFVRVADSHTLSRSYLGTPGYMAPELVMMGLVGGTIKNVFLVDIWALGITIFECVTGQRPRYDLEQAGQLAKRDRNMAHFDAEYQKLIQQVQDSRTTPGCKALMRGMLGMKENRLNVKQVKHHPWFEVQPLLWTAPMTPAATPRSARR